ncbi:hypothetical protein GUY44_24550 [Pimelobacter simplex]|uniref:hypothetical protein n=1 Tax=Nocardioides simplex TaxID=2045 RepID=UPI0008E27FEF|nr:hypothetical protein [Pimelobacter simplex]MCG8153668.1 hypothetical protein [Pimelobacter simplex]GEB17144.1 hypothetical protein NSI01_54590 [Pimelobacter simplex]SFN08485.1 hypothetical protein SAMN05421671_5031 [Pimelobacter simplex]
MHLMTSVRRTVAALTLSTALVAGTAALAAPAHAERWTHDDAVGDVVRETMGEPGAELTPAPERTSIDITRVVANHKGRNLTIKVRTRSAMKGVLMSTSTIRTPSKRLMLMSSRIPMFGSSLDLYDINTKRRDPSVRCPGLKRTFDKSRTVMTTTIPRSCLGNPRWVRFSVDLATADLLADDDYSYQEDGLRDGSGSGFGPRKMSPKIKHG